MDEEWRPYPPAPQYLVSNLGRVRGPRGGILSQCKASFTNKSDYALYQVTIAGKSTPIHKMVALVFVGERPEGMTIDHINQNPLDNRADNLQYVTHRKNHELRSERRTHCKNGHPMDDVGRTYKAGGFERICVICRRTWQRDYYRRKTAAAAAR